MKHYSVLRATKRSSQDSPFVREVEAEFGLVYKNIHGEKMLAIIAKKQTKNNKINVLFLRLGNVEKKRVIYQFYKSLLFINNGNILWSVIYTDLQISNLGLFTHNSYPVVEVKIVQSRDGSLPTKTVLLIISRIITNFNPVILYECFVKRVQRRIQRHTWLLHTSLSSAHGCKGWRCAYISRLN